jgi:hypothetical protein
MTKEQYEDISRIFLPNDNYKLKFTSRWEHTRENVGKHIVEDNIPVSFPLKKYFELYDYLKDNNLIEK